MEEKKFDKNSLIGFLLLFVIIAWMMYNTQEKAQKEQLAKAKTEKATPKPVSYTHLDVYKRQGNNGKNQYGNDPKNPSHEIQNIGVE